MRAGACEMHIRGRVCVHENPAGSRRDSDVQSVLERKGESREAGSDRPKEGRRRNAGWECVRAGQPPVRFSRPWNGELDEEERKGRESRRRWRR